jgi:hypothetical protein
MLGKDAPAGTMAMVAGALSARARSRPSAHGATAAPLQKSRSADSDPLLSTGAFEEALIARPTIFVSLSEWLASQAATLDGFREPAAISDERVIEIRLSKVVRLVRQ